MNEEQVKDRPNNSKNMNLGLFGFEPRSDAKGERERERKSQQESRLNGWNVTSDRNEHEI